MLVYRTGGATPIPCHRFQTVGDTLVIVGRLLIVAGLILIVLGIAVTLLSKTSMPLGRLPGDIVWRGKNTTFYFPIVTCILLSIAGSLLLWLLGRR